MKAFVTSGDGIARLRRRELPEPTAGPGQVLVRMRAVSLNYRDLLVVEGTADWKPVAERIPVSDGAGVVVSVGPGVSRWEPGDRVVGLFLPRWQSGELTDETYRDPLGGPTADGVLAELVVFAEDAVVAPPAEWTDAEAATLPVAALTAWHALRRTGVAAGDRVLIEGTGGVSLFALQLARALGARPIVISSSDDKLERARQLGAEATIHYRRTPQWEEPVLELTDGRGVDQVVEVVGGEHLNRALRAVRIGGAIAYVGLLAGLRAPIDVWRFVSKNVTLHGIETGSREMFDEMNAFLAQHELRPVIGRRFPFDQAREALTELRAARHVGKIVLDLP